VVATICQAIWSHAGNTERAVQRHPEGRDRASAGNAREAFQYTIKRNTVAVVSDGTAVLGLGDIGPRAAMPVMEGKAMLFKEFAGVDAFPICLDTQDTDEIVGVVQAIAPGFGGVNLEDISAPRCFEIEERLKEALDIPSHHAAVAWLSAAPGPAYRSAAARSASRLGERWPTA
jgi:Malic enzyme, N-terminal domain